MSYDLKVIDQASNMRANGFSLKQISSKLNISKSTASLWTSKVIISKEGKQKILIHQISARKKGLLTINKRRKLIKTAIRKKVETYTNEIKVTPEIGKLLVSLFIWTEGQKWDLNTVGFTNSDPLMISTFLRLFRRFFILDESKLRALVHIHEYHNNKQTIKFWSELTKIPTTQFSKSYLKPHTSKRKKANYRGCIRINYYDYKVAHELAYLYNTFAKNIRL